MGNICLCTKRSFEWQDDEQSYKKCSFEEPLWFHVVNTVLTGKDRNYDKSILYTPYEWVIPTSCKPVHWPVQMLRWDYQIKEYEFRNIIDTLRLNPETEENKGIFQFAEWLESWEGKCDKLSRRVCYISSF